ncbi:MAG: hypothetical protein N4A33_06205 [Bacteriovoracaceae bacterium]|jgi:hypothetical protein|nr:hypothetical protein [Bacteriovoracaceae bacterium]
MRKRTLKPFLNLSEIYFIFVYTFIIVKENINQNGLKVESSKLIAGAINQ